MHDRRGGWRDPGLNLFSGLFPKVIPRRVFQRLRCAASEFVSLLGLAEELSRSVEVHVHDWEVFGLRCNGEYSRPVADGVGACVEKRNPT
ncbi:MAG: hypothetical protein ACU0A0_01740 [Limimaricola sp.]